MSIKLFSFLKGIIDISVLYRSLKPHMSFIIVDIFPKAMAITPEELKLWEEDPIQFVTRIYDVYYEELTDVNNHDCKIKMFVSKMAPEYAKNDPALIVTDYLSMMTDSYVLNEYETIFLPIMHNTIL